MFDKWFDKYVHMCMYFCLLSHGSICTKDTLTCDGATITHFQLSIVNLDNCFNDPFSTATVQSVSDLHHSYPISSCQIKFQEISVHFTVFDAVECVVIPIVSFVWRTVVVPAFCFWSNYCQFLNFCFCDDTEFADNSIELHIAYLLLLTTKLLQMTYSLPF